MGILFDSYQLGAVVFCDISDETIDCLPPNSRLLCDVLTVNCGTVSNCSRLIVGDGLVLCDCGDSVNCNLCGNDTPFWNPVEFGDTFTFQFQQPNFTTFNNDGWTSFTMLDILSGMAYFEIRTCCDDQLVEFDPSLFDTFVLNQFVGRFETFAYNGTEIRNEIQQIEFDLSAIAAYLITNNIEPCFYFKFGFSTNTQSVNSLYKDNPELIDFFCSEPFKYEPCPIPKRSVLIESIYSSTDCFGMYYGNNWTFTWGGTPFVYSNQLRVPAYFENDSFQISKSIIESSRKTTGTQVCESWTMKTFPLPNPFAKKLVMIIAGADVYIDGREYNFQGEITKNNETGSRWWSDIKFEHCDCSKNLTC
jgi:hypothetical protein